MPEWLKDELTALAKADDRSRSKWIARELAQLLEQKQSDQFTVLPKAAADSGCYPVKKTKAP